VSVVELSAPPSIFGRIVTGYDVEQAVLAVLQRWSSTYIAELERQHGITACSIARVRGWSLAPSFDKWPEDQVPGVLVVSTGAAAPIRHGDGTYRATWAVELGCVVSAQTQQLSRELAMLMLSAHKAIIVQRPSLEGFADGTRWLAESYTALPFDDTRSLYAASATLAIDVEDVLTSLAGPVTPDNPPADPCAPFAPWPTVETVDVEVDNYPPPTSLP
jgi:hypothetical protein